MVVIGSPSKPSKPTTKSRTKQMMRVLSFVVIALGLAACEPKVPDSGAGVGFKDYDTYLAEQRARDQALATGQPPVTVRPPAEPVNPVTEPVVVVVTQTPEQQTASAAVAAVRGTQTATSTVPATQVAAAPNTDNPNLSDEQDFQAVSARQTIASDADRRKAQSEQYQVIAPKALPSRPRGGSQTPIEFAVATSHPVGQKVYRRSPFTDKSAKGCGKFTSGEAAQDAFLKAGGPKRDKLGLDPDGDGYACRWDPSVYRVARSN
jgi:hypothetical protein